MYHEPVLLREAVQGLNVKKNGVYVDATFGGGGQAKAILKKLDEGKLFAFDQDESAARNVIEDERLIFINQNFRHLKKMLRVHGVAQVDGVLGDLGVSSFQIDTGNRGFAHRLEGKLDMRMDEHSGKKASDILNSYSATQLQKIFSEYGEVRNAKTLSEKIVEARKGQRFENIDAFVKAIEPCIKGNRNRYLSQVFQALRIEVNDELNALKDFLDQTKDVLKSGGRLVVISYHSLEDRIVKNFIRSGSPDGIELKDDFGNIKKLFLPISKKPIEATTEEIKINPRARSAKMRIAERI
ncbi:MAG TPA: 16S rRNA (cytosine(1402)-N(4))-methyltransferase RsmH [Chitinophagales bacterium]|nr:16S rRNA (cytosine(1402)-N(4))-methyltransferase RsmH [Chitinophagales bacterium]